MGKPSCEASSMFGFETRRDGLKSRIEGCSRAHIKVLMRSTSPFSIFDFDMAISGPDRDPRVAIQNPLAKHMHDLSKTRLGVSPYALQNRRRKHMHFHFLRLSAIDLAQPQKVPCEAPALSRSAFTPLHSLSKHTYSRLGPKSRSVRRTVCKAPCGSSRILDETRPRPFASPAETPHEEHTSRYLAGQIIKICYLAGQIAGRVLLVRVFRRNGEWSGTSFVEKSRKARTFGGGLA
jgi:hypothetical protein